LLAQPAYYLRAISGLEATILPSLSVSRKKLSAILAESAVASIVILTR
jgi:hypothetical protein